MKKIFVLSIMFICFFVGIVNVKANSINEIKMDIYINSSGDAYINEFWKAYLINGTEGYRSFSNLGNSIISNFSVTDDKQNNYELLPTWNTNASFDYKSYKCGINYNASSIELCWGISEYGNRTYYLSYKISNFITQYTDTQGIYFNVLNLDQSVTNAVITIHSDFDFSLDNSRIWGYGYSGNINFVDGKIVMQNKKVLDSDEYMTLLVRFEDNLFNTKSFSNKSFDDIFDEANEDKNNNKRSAANVLGFIEIIGGAIIIIGIVYIFLFVIPIKLIKFIINKIKSLFNKKNRNEDVKFAKIISISELNKVPYYRDIPCDKNLELAYWVIYRYFNANINKLNKGMLNAVILKWLKLKYVSIDENNNIILNREVVDSVITGENKFKLTHQEQELYRMFYRVSTHDKSHVVNKKSFKKWCKLNYNSLYTWFEDINSYTESKLKYKKMIYSDNFTEKERSSKRNEYKTIIKEEVNEYAKELMGLKKFLNDFSSIEDREAIEVEIWEYYLIFAQILGISKKVVKQFKELYPDFSEVSDIDIFKNVHFVDSFVDRSYNNMVSYKNNNKIYGSSSHNYSGDSSYSGGGGDSSSSGGSSAGGSSGGGFR